MLVLGFMFCFWVLCVGFMFCFVFGALCLHMILFTELRDRHDRDIEFACFVELFVLGVGFFCHHNKGMFVDR